MQLHTWLQRQAAHPRPLSRRLVSQLQRLSHVIGLCSYCALWQCCGLLQCLVQR